MQRANLTWLGTHGPASATRHTFRVVLVLVVAYTVYSTCLEYASIPTPDQYGEIDYADVNIGVYALKLIGCALFTAWSLYALCRTRESLRAKYSIPEDSRLGGCEDLACSVCCSCCVVAQMLRHTGEYELREGVCCSETGMEKGAPLVV